MWTAFIYIIITASLAFFLCIVSRQRKSLTSTDLLVDKVDACLPQTQCRACGYAGCRPYAHAVVHNEVGINYCVPGDMQTVRALAILTGNSVVPVIKAEAVKSYAAIEEEYCIGCTKCVKACPVDAIIGAAKQMHSVLPEYCTGCGLCVAPCPVDCISLLPL